MEVLSSAIVFAWWVVFSIAEASIVLVDIIVTYPASNAKCCGSAGKLASGIAHSGDRIPTIRWATCQRYIGLHRPQVVLPVVGRRAIFIIAHVHGTVVGVGAVKSHCWVNTPTVSIAKQRMPGLAGPQSLKSLRSLRSVRSVEFDSTSVIIRSA